MLSFSRIITLSIVTLFACCLTIERSRADVIGLSLPLSGEISELGRDFRTGANFAMEKYGAGHALFIADDGCDPDLANLAIDDLVKQSPVIVTGFLCNSVALKAANQFRNSGIPLLIAGARSVRLIKDRKREAWNLWRLSPGDDYSYRASVDILEKRWGNKPFSVIDDGTIYGRAYTDGLRLALNETSAKPQISDNFRAAQSTQAGLLRRIQRSGVEASFIASATFEDLITIARNKQELDVKVDLMFPEQMALLPFVEDIDEIEAGPLVVMPHYAPTKERLDLEAKLESQNITPTAQIFAGYQAIQVAIEAVAQARSMSERRLQTRLFNTILGPVKFDNKGANIINPYKLHQWDGTNLVMIDETQPVQQY